jgi:transcriptional regulator with XRE-family HTH domain
MTDLRRQLAVNMKERRRVLGLSQEKLAEKLDSATTYIAMIEGQKKFPSVKMLERIAKALEVDPLELFSVESFPAATLKKLHKEVLEGFQGVLSEKLRQLEGEI